MRLAAAVDIGGTRTKVGIVGEDGGVLVSASLPTLDGEPELLLARITGALAPMLRQHDVQCLGVAVAGFLDDDRSAMIANANLTSLQRYPLRDALAERLRLDCRLEVDSNASTIAEFRFGAGKGASRLLGITVGTGIGGGVILDGRVLRHTGGCAGDLGHVILSPDGRACTCGARGCLEAMACAGALSERGKGAVDDIIMGARTGEQRSREALEETGWWLGLGLAALAPLFAPDVIVVGGGVAAAGELLMEPTRRSFLDHVSDELRGSVRLERSWFDGWEGMIGAACQCLDPLE
jgi:glucokinase